MMNFGSFLETLLAAIGSLWALVVDLLGARVLRAVRPSIHEGAVLTAETGEITELGLRQVTSESDRYTDLTLFDGEHYATDDAASFVLVDEATPLLASRTYTL